MRIAEEFQVRIIYKSGAEHTFWTEKFDAIRDPEGGLMNAEWQSIENDNKPVYMGVDNIVAVWQVGYRRRLRFG